MVVNLDDTSFNYVRTSNWTVEEIGSHQVPLTGLDDKRAITGVLACSMAGELLPPQFLYAGKTNQCHSDCSFPDYWDIWHSPSHWSNHLTMAHCVEKIIVRYLAKQCESLDLPADTPRLVVMNVCRAYRTPDILVVLEQSGCLL